MVACNHFEDKGALRLDIATKMIPQILTCVFLEKKKTCLIQNFLKIVLWEHFCVNFLFENVLNLHSVRGGLSTAKCHRPQLLQDWQQTLCCCVAIPAEHPLSATRLLMTYLQLLWNTYLSDEFLRNQARKIMIGEVRAIQWTAGLWKLKSCCPHPLPDNRLLETPNQETPAAGGSFLYSNLSAVKTSSRGVNPR